MTSGPGQCGARLTAHDGPARPEPLRGLALRGTKELEHPELMHSGAIVLRDMMRRDTASAAMPMSVFGNSTAPGIPGLENAAASFFQSLRRCADRTFLLRVSCLLGG